MAKGLIINRNVWAMVRLLEPEECKELLDGLAAYHLGEEMPTMSRSATMAFQAIASDNYRFSDERKAEIASRRAEAGRKGMSSRWQTEAPITNITNITNDNKNNKNEGLLSKRLPVCPLFEHEEVLAAWREYKQMRERIRKPMATDRTVTMAVNRLMELSKGNPTEAVKILEQSVDHCWIGLFAIKEDWKGRRQPQPYEAKETRGTDYDAATRELFLKNLKGG